VFLLLSKVLDLAVAPITWVLALLLLAAAARGHARRQLVLGAGAGGVLVLFSLAPLSERLARLAEAGATRTFRPDATYDAVVVLGGLVDGAASRASGDDELTEAADRVTRALELWREGRVKAVVLSAGNAGLRPGEPSEADHLSARLQAWGVPAEAIVVEGRSRNTRENAIETARVVAERGYRSLVLVTSAAHMPRALGCFRAVGLAPDALPVDRHASDNRDDSWLPRASALAESTDALRELTGRAVYRVAGYTR
jgi:uncharacterized SAM-binding protein YcdF (DUF218 family)